MPVHLFAVVQSVVPLLIVPLNGEVIKCLFTSFVVKLILTLINSQKADWPSHKHLWFVILVVIKYLFFF